MGFEHKSLRNRKWCQERHKITSYIGLGDIAGLPLTGLRFYSFCIHNELGFEFQMDMNSNSLICEVGIFLKIGIMLKAPSTLLSNTFRPFPSLSQRCHSTLKLECQLLCLSVLLTLCGRSLLLLFISCLVSSASSTWLFLRFQMCDVLYLLRKMFYIQLNYLVFSFLCQAVSWFPDFTTVSSTFKN